MKKILLIIVGVVVLLIVGLGIFIVTFDANRYRPALIQKVEESLGRPVRLDSLKLTFHNGLALELRGFAVYSDDSKKTALLSLDDLTVTVRLVPLLSKRIEITSLEVTNPRVNLERDANGRMIIPGPVPAPGGKTSTSGAGASSAFSVDLIRVKHGEITFTDRANKPPMHIKIRAIDATVKNFSMVAPFSIDLRAAIFSSSQNAQFTGTLQLPLASRQGTLRNAVLLLTLDSLNLPEMEQSLPQLGTLPIRDGGLAGKLQINIDHAELNANALRSSKVAVRLADGKLALKSVQSPIEKIQLDAVLEKENLAIKNLSADFAQGTVKISGNAEQVFKPNPVSHVNVLLRGMSLRSLLIQPRTQQTQVDGMLSAELNADLRGTTWPVISKSISGTGRLQLTNLALSNFNLVREAFSRLEVIPGVTESLRSKLPPVYRAKVDAPNTVFAPIDLPIRITNGQCTFNSLRLATDHYTLDAQGVIGLDQSLGAQAVLRISPELSTAAVRGVNDLQYLQNPQGQIELPLEVKGVIPNVKVIPDLSYAAQRLAMSKAQELVGGYLTKSLQGDSATASNSAQGTAANTAGGQQAADTSDPLAGLLQKALGANSK